MEHRRKSSWILTRLAILIMLAGLQVSAMAEVTPVREGKSRCAIVLAEKPTRSAQLAARELQHHVRLITDVELKILRENETRPDGMLPMYIGESKATAKMGLTSGGFKTQEHLVRITDDAIVLIGHDDPDTGAISYEKNGGWPGINPRAPNFQVGTLYAVYDFLERECDVRWYMVTDLGTVYSRRPTLSVQTAERRHRPWATLRRLGTGHWAKPGTIGRPDRMRYVRNSQSAGTRANVLHTLRTRYNGSSFQPAAHSFYGYDRLYGKDHADWFVDDKPGPNVQLRFWKDEVVEQVVRNILEYFGKPRAERKKGMSDPRFRGGHGEVFAIGPLDHRKFGKQCKPPLEPKRKRPGTFMDGIASEYWFTFVNRVAKRVREAHPDKWIASPAYASHFEPPSFELESNVGVCMANTEGWAPESYGQENLDAWRKKVKRLFVYEYWYSKGLFPPVRTHAAAAYAKRLRSLGIEGLFMEMISNSNTAVFHLDNYVMMRMLYDDGAKVDDLIDEYFRRFYGSAQEPMRRFWKILEEEYPKVRKLALRDPSLHWLAVAGSDVMERLGRELSAAEKAAPKEPYASRLRVIRRGVYGMMRERIAFAEYTNGKRRRTPCPMVTKTLKIDGVLTDPAWKRAAATVPFVSAGNVPTDVRTTAKIMRDAKHLYVAVQCPEPFMDKIKAVGAKRDQAAIRKDDRVHIVLDVDRTRRRYYHLIVNANGTVLDEIVTAERGTTWRSVNRIIKSQRLAWSPNTRAAVAKQKDGWTVEIQIPLADLGPAQPGTGDAWGLNLVRCRPHLDSDGIDPLLTMWAPTFTPTGFNFPDQFGVLVMRNALMGHRPVVAFTFENDFLSSKQVTDTSVKGKRRGKGSSGALSAKRLVKAWDKENVATGFRGKAIAFAGKDSHQYLSVQLGDGVNLSTDDFTVALRYRMIKWGGVIVTNTISTSGRDHYWALTCAKEALYSRVRAATKVGEPAPTPGGFHSLKAYEALKDGLWHQIVLVADRGNQLRLYIDRKLVAQGDISMVKKPLANALFVGTYYGSPRCEVDDLMVYQGASNQEDVNALFETK